MHHGEAARPGSCTRALALASLLALFSSHACWAATTGAAVLDINTSARAAAMGEAYTALANSADALNWNAAGILRSPTASDHPAAGITVSHQNHFSDSNVDNLGLALPVKSAAGGFAWGFNVTRLGYAPQDRVLADGEKAGTFQSNDMVVGLALAHDFGSFQAGTQVKAIRLELDGTQAKGMALDLGLLSRTGIRGLSLGASVRNIGAAMSFVQEKFNLPLVASVGAAYRVSEPFTLAADVVSRPNDHQLALSVGTEIVAIKTVSLRTGYITRLSQAIQSNDHAETIRGNVAGLDGFNAGLGLQVGRFTMDYSMSPFGELGTTQILTLATTFGHAEEKSPFSLSTETPAESTPQSSLPAEMPVLIVPADERLLLELTFPAAEETWWFHLKP